MVEHRHGGLKTWWNIDMVDHRHGGTLTQTPAQHNVTALFSGLVKITTDYVVFRMRMKKQCVLN